MSSVEHASCRSSRGDAHADAFAVGGAAHVGGRERLADRHSPCVMASDSVALEVWTTRTPPSSACAQNFLQHAIGRPCGRCAHDDIARSKRDRLGERLCKGQGAAVRGNPGQAPQRRARQDLRRRGDDRVELPVGLLTSGR